MVKACVYVNSVFSIDGFREVYACIFILVLKSLWYFFIRDKLQHKHFLEVLAPEFTSHIQPSFECSFIFARDNRALIAGYDNKRLERLSDFIFCQCADSTVFTEYIYLEYTKPRLPISWQMSLFSQIPTNHKRNYHVPMCIATKPFACVIFISTI